MIIFLVAVDFTFNQSFELTSPNNPRSGLQIMRADDETDLVGFSQLNNGRVYAQTTRYNGRRTPSSIDFF